MTRFCCHQVALIGDIEKAFLMVGVSEADCDVLRFRWVRYPYATEPKVEIKRFTHLVLIVSSSPFRCSFARLALFCPKTNGVALWQVYLLPGRQQNNLLLLQRELQVLFSCEHLTFPLYDVVLRASALQAKLLWTCKFQVCQHLSTWDVFK